ncbi:MAG: xanthine dehydrogenase accessory factor [Gammaproteobacteria bacterium]|jgi:xanthine dehydrogenase accessory factor
MNSSLTGIVKTFLSLQDKQQHFVLATIIETSGSTYRKAGARLLITQSGKFYGLLGGGCFEADLLEHAREVFNLRKTQTVYYDMRGPEDLVWGLGLGCNGAVKIRLEYLSQENNYAPISTILAGLNLNQKCVVATVCDSTHPDLLPDSHFLISSDEDSTEGEPVPKAIYDLAIKTLYSGVCLLVTVEIDGHQIDIFMARILPPIHLLIIGGGPDSMPVINTAQLLGWNVTVVDYRDSYSNPDNFPDNVFIVNSSPEELDKKIELCKIDAVVLMTHKFEYDLSYLKNLVASSVPYIGLLGPIARRDELLRMLETPSDDFIKRVYGPVGLNIGGELPEEIALSLIAEIQAVVNKRHGNHLTNIVDNISIIILAAGSSSRFGALKQLLEYQGKSLLKRAVEISQKVQCLEVLVVHGPKATKCQREISSYNVVNLVNDDWESGMSSSLKLAVKSVSSESQAILVLLCDQPLITSDHLNQLIRLWRQNPDNIVASEYNDTIGVPAIIPKLHYNAIKKLTGDTGAKTIIQTFGKKVIVASIPEAEFDIDTENDFARLLSGKIN